MLVHRICHDDFFYWVQLGFRWNLMPLLLKFQLSPRDFFHLNILHFSVGALKFVNNLIGNTLIFVFFWNRIWLNFRISSGLVFHNIRFKRLVARDLFLKILIEQCEILNEVAFHCIYGVVPLKRCLIAKSLKINGKKVI